MSAPMSRDNVLVGVDGSPAANCAVNWAAREAASRNVGLTVIHAVRRINLPQPLPTSLHQWQAEQARRVVEEAVEIARQSSRDGGPAQIETQVLFSAVVPALVELSATADIVVVGPRGRGAVARTLLGSVSSSLIRHAHCPVAVIHDADPLMPDPVQAPVLVGIDGSPASELATAIAFDQASRRGVELVALHVWSDIESDDFAEIDWPAEKPAAEETLAERLAGWQERYPDVPVRRVVEFHRPTHHLITLSESAQLVVVGSHGLGGFAGMLLGSVGAAVAHGSRTPVIVARR